MTQWTGLPVASDLQMNERWANLISSQQQKIWPKNIGNWFTLDDRICRYERPKSILSAEVI